MTGLTGSSSRPIDFVNRLFENRDWPDLHKNSEWERIV